jgi:AcrR family transcriptional regulator
MEPRRRATRDETRALILEKAESLFRQFGFAKTTVADIASEAGMSTANVYKYFPSKDAIVAAGAALNFGHLMAALVRIVGGEGSAVDRLETMVLTIARTLRDIFRSERQLYKLIATCIEQNWACVQEFDEELVSVVAGLLQEGMRAGEFSVMAPAATARVLLESLKSVTHPLLLGKIADADVEKRACEQVRFLARALR